MILGIILATTITTDPPIQLPPRNIEKIEVADPGMVITADTKNGGWKWVPLKELCKKKVRRE